MFNDNKCCELLIN